MKKILVTGANGQLGRCIRRISDGRSDIDITYADVEELDLRDRDAVEQAIASGRYDYVINRLGKKDFFVPKQKAQRVDMAFL